MNRNRLKIAALSVVASLALSAVVATAASAGSFEAESYPATITGEQTTQVVFSGVVGSWACKKLSMSGELTEKLSKLNLAPLYSECSWAGIGATTMMEGCTYEFVAGNTIEGSEARVQATMSIKCPAGKEVKLVLNGGTCTIRIPPQINLASATAESTGSGKSGDVDLKLSLTGITYSVENGAFPCPNNPGSGTYNNGSLTGTETLKAENSGEAVGFKVS
jgi:hypothetical protein